MEPQKRRKGRPSKAAEIGDRVSLGLRVTPKIKNLLDQAATLNGRSQSAEAASRLESTFRMEGLLPEVLILRYGQHLAGLIAMLAEVSYQTVRSFQALPLLEGGEWSHIDEPDAWLRDPALFEILRRALAGTLDTIAPEGVAQRIDFDFYAKTNIESAMAGTDRSTEAVPGMTKILEPIRQAAKAKRDGNRS
jgi:hypothetical protein